MKKQRNLITILISILCIFFTANVFANQKINAKKLLAVEDSGSKRTSIDEVVLPENMNLPLQGFTEERLYYFLDGRGVMSIYEEFPHGDVYELRQDTAIYMTPGIKHELMNTGNSPLRYVLFKVEGGIVPEGDLSWSAVSQRGVTVDKPMVGSGQATTKVFDEGSNPSKEEGLHLRIRDIWLRRPQKFANAEVLTVAPGRSTRLHNHYDTGETCYILVGEGNFIWNDKQITCQAGSCISYPPGVLRKIENTGKYPLSYICISSFLE